MKRLKFNEIAPGDIIFTARPGKLGSGIRFMSDGDVSHAMICVQSGSFIDSTSNGVQASNFQRELFQDDELAFHFRLKDTPAPQIIDRVITYARTAVGTRYSKSEAVRSVQAIRKPRSTKQFCSRFIARAFKAAGIYLVSDVDYCTPEDLKNSPLLEQIPVEFEAIIDSDLEWVNDPDDPINATHDAINAVLKTARKFNPKIETFNDIYDLLIERPQVD